MIRCTPCLSLPPSSSCPFVLDTFRCICVPAVVPQHMVSTPGVPFNNLFCLQVLLRWARVSAAAVLLATCLFSCLIGVSILVADGVSVVDTLPSCVWMMTVPAVLACMATNLGRKMWSALWVSSHSLLPQFAYLAVMSRGCALLSNPATNRSRNNALFWY